MVLFKGNKSFSDDPGAIPYFQVHLSRLAISWPLSPDGTEVTPCVTLRSRSLTKVVECRGSRCYSQYSDRNPRQYDRGSIEDEVVAAIVVSGDVEVVPDDTYFRVSDEVHFPYVVVSEAATVNEADRANMTESFIRATSDDGGSRTRCSDVTCNENGRESLRRSCCEARMRRRSHRSKLLN